MMLGLLKVLLLSCPLLHAEINKPLHVQSLSGTVTLSRFEDQTWPLEAGQDLPGDITLNLTKDALIGLRVNKRVDLLISGPARLSVFALEHEEGETLQQELLLRVESGSCYFDPRFLFGRPSNITVELPDSTFELKSGLPIMLSAAPQRKTIFSKLNASGAVSSGPDFKNWPKAFATAALEPVPVLVLCRDYDKELKIWPRPAVLGPALVKALSGNPGLHLVDGSGSTMLAHFANNALRKGEDFFVQQLARERGARLVLVGNLVVEELRDESPSLRRHPLMSAVAELRVLESFERGDVVVSDMGSTLNARAGRPLEIAGREALEGAAVRAARYIRGDFEQLLQGQAHAPQLLSLVFQKVTASEQRELRRGLSDLESVQRFFRRSFSSGVLKMDVQLRGSREDFLRQLEQFEFESFSLKRTNASTPSETELDFGLSPKVLPKAKK